MHEIKVGFRYVGVFSLIMKHFWVTYIFEILTYCCNIELWNGAWGTWILGAIFSVNQQCGKISFKFIPSFENEIKNFTDSFSR